jgi:hypothetical protein
MGLFFAIQWLRGMNLDHIDFASDSKIVTEAFHHQRPDITEFGQLMTAIRRLFASSFTNSRVAPFNASPTIYIDVPHCIEHYIVNEML